MEIITRQSLANIAAYRWELQYCHGGLWRDTLSGNSEIVYRKLLALGNSPAPDDIDKIIGNTGWTHPERCSECNVRGDIVIRVGQEPDFESNTAYLCVDCTRKAFEAFESAVSQEKAG